MQFFDFIVTGGDLASLSLVLHMLGSPLRDKRVLMVADPCEPAEQCSYGFWYRQPGLYDEILFNTWPRGRLAGPTGESELSLGAYRYGLIRAVDFHRFVNERIDVVPTIERIVVPIERIYDAAGQARLKSGQDEFSANWLFDGSGRPDRITSQDSHFIHLKKQVKGWEIETVQDCFNPDLPTFFDTRVRQESQLRYMQVFPFSARRALVEFNAFTRELLHGDDVSRTMEEYLKDTLKIYQFQVLNREDRVTPLTDQPFLRRDGFRVLRIGCGAGLVKPSTGLCFQSIHRDSHAIVTSLLQNFHPFKLPKSAARYRLFDSAVLQLLADRGEQGERRVTRLLMRRPVERFLRFLDEEGMRQDDLALLAGLPAPLLLRAAIRLRS